MEEWKEYKLGEVVNILDYKRVPLSSKERSTRQGIYPYYGAQGIIDYIDDYIFDGTYLLIAEDGENLKSQKQKIAQLASGKYWVNNHAHIVESNGKSDIRYIYYILNQLDISGYITGTAQPKLNQANLNSISVKLPSLDNQKRIADCLSFFDDKIELNRRINDNLEQQAQALFKHWFVDFGPFKNGEFVESELGMIPKGWRVGKLGNLCKYSSEKISVKELKNYNYYSTENILPNKQGVISATKLPEVDKVIKCDPGDTVISNIRPYFKKIYYCSEDVAGCSADVLCFSPNNRLHSSFIYNILYSDRFFEYVMLGSKGTKMPRGDKKHIMDYQVVIPDEIYMKKYCIFASDTLEKIDICRKESRRLTQLRDTILPKLMSGQIKL